MALNKQETESITKEFALSPNDTGSIEVQIALLTSNIKKLTGHCQQNKGDFSAQRGLIKLVHRRRTFLRYIDRIDSAKYRDIIGRLSLRG